MPAPATTTSGKQRPCRRAELVERVEDGLTVDYGMGVLSICLASDSLISELRPEIIYSINTTTAFETSNATSEYAAATSFDL